MEKRRRETENGLGRQKTTGNSDDIKLRERKKKTAGEAGARAPGCTSARV